MRLRTAAIAVVALTLSLSLAAPGSAAVFVKYDGVDGESKDANHDKWIDVLGIDWGSHRPGGGATGAAANRLGGSAQNMRLTLTLPYEKSSPKLQEKCLAGLLLPAVQMHVGAPGRGQQTKYAYKLKKVMVTSYQVHAPGYGPRPKGMAEDKPFVQITMLVESASWTAAGTQ